VSRSIRKSTNKVYEGRFREFQRWCQERDTDPFDTSVQTIANFLGSLFRKDLSYSTICGYRSAISMFHNPIDGAKVGENKLLIKLLRGVFNRRPPKKAEIPIWDLAVVLKGLTQAPFEPMVSAKPKHLAWKTAFLLAICTASRSSDLQRWGHKAPHVRFLPQQGSVILTPRLLKKQCRPGHLLKEAILPKFQENRKLDPVRALKVYLDKVASTRGSIQNLFITAGTKKKAAAAQTIANWLSNTISLTYEMASKGVPDKTNAHTLRGMAASMAKLKRVPIQAILDAADWSSESTFGRFYLKDVTTNRTSFGRAILEEGL
jgi:hypothetical protein